MESIWVQGIEYTKRFCNQCKIMSLTKVYCQYCNKKLEYVQKYRDPHWVV